MTKAAESRAWRGQIRMPAPLAAWLIERASSHYRSINAEIVDLVLRAKEQNTHLPASQEGIAK